MQLAPRHMHKDWLSYPVPAARCRDSGFVLQRVGEGSLNE